jgi:hypothetical protein
LVDKGQPVSELLSTIRQVTRGETVLPAIPPDLQNAAMTRLDDDDVAVAAMLLAGTSRHDVAETLGIEPREVAIRARRAVARVRPNGRPTRHVSRNGATVAGASRSAPADA